MKYYSEVTSKLYESEEDLLKAEKEFEIKKAEQESRKRKSQEEKRLEKEKYIKNIKDAENEYLKVKEDYDHLVNTYSKKCSELAEKYYDAIRAYNDRYGVYSETVESEAADKYFRRFLNLL